MPLSLRADGEALGAVALPAAPLNFVAGIEAVCMEGRGPAGCASTWQETRDWGPVGQGRASLLRDVSRTGLLTAICPGDCAYRNNFFVTHNREAALAPGFCFITPFYWSRKK